MSIEQWTNRTPNVTDHWQLDGNHPGTRVNPVLFTQGVEGQAAFTTGGGGFTHTPQLSRTRSTFSVCLWVRPGEVGGDVFQWGTSPGVQISSTPSGGRATLGAAVRMSNGRFAVNHTSLADQGRWHLVVVTVRSTTIWGGVQARVYINGQQQAQGSYGGGLFNVVNMNRTNPLRVMASGVAAAVDEVVLVDRELGAAEVSALWDAGEGGVAGPAAGWGVIIG